MTYPPKIMKKLYFILVNCIGWQVCVCQSVRERERQRDYMRVGVCMWMCGDMVYGCGCVGGQDENSDYTCASYIAYQSYLNVWVTVYFVTNIILSNNVYDISIVCLLLRSLKFWIIYIWSFSFFFLLFIFIFNMFMFCWCFWGCCCCCCFCCVCFFRGLLVPLNGIKKYLAWPDKINRNGGLPTNLMAKPQQSKDYSLQQINEWVRVERLKEFCHLIKVWNA